MISSSVRLVGGIRRYTLKISINVMSSCTAINDRKESQKPNSRHSHGNCCVVMLWREAGELFPIYIDNYTAGYGGVL